jgi:hypothetical protein
MPAKALAGAQSMPFGGVMYPDLAPKQSLRTWASLRRAVMNFRQPAAAGAAPTAEARPAPEGT